MKEKMEQGSKLLQMLRKTLRWGRMRREIMRRRAKLVDDRRWREVMFGNNYALFVCYLSMAVKGLGFLVLTWTTVVLLGGFVSTLQKKDFWCLTFITLVQTAGIFDVFLTEKLSYIGNSFWAVVAVRYAVLRDNPLQRKRQVLATGVAIVQVLVFCILLCPLAALYMFGLLISAGISVWRLKRHDYGNDTGVGNLKPALDVLYSLALLQGVIFCYKAIFGFAKGSVVNTIIEEREFGEQTRIPISDYLTEMTIGCENNPSFARGRNLITYAVDLMGSKSPDDYLSGVRVLDAFAKQLEKVVRKREEDLIQSPWVLKDYMGENILKKYLIVSASSSDILKKLLETLSHRSIYDRKTRGCAARIVANIALDIRLEEFPRGIHYISSLIDTFEVYRLLQPCQRDWLAETFEDDWYLADPIQPPDLDKKDNDANLMHGYLELVVQGLRILTKLATNSENCRVMLDTPGLLYKIMAPVTSDLLHHIDHGPWNSIVEGSLKVIDNLTAAIGQTGKKLRSEISSSKEAINNMERILECDKCNEKLQTKVILILSKLYQDTPSILGTLSREKFIEMLVDIMADHNKDKGNKRITAGRALIELSSETETSAAIIMKANDNVVDNLASMIVEKRRYRLVAAKILEYLCTHYTDDDESLKKLKDAMTDAVPKVLEDIFCWASEEKHIRTKVNQVRSTKPENQCGDTQDNGRGNNSSSSNQGDYKMSEYGVTCMLSLCLTVCNTFSADQNLAHQFDVITPEDGSSSFPRKLEKIVRKNTHLRSDCLSIVKLACKMFISMMKHRGSYVKEDLESLMRALSFASICMFRLDGSMVFEIRGWCGGTEAFPESGFPRERSTGTYGHKQWILS